MPELPEVETTRRMLVKSLEGQTLTQAIVRSPKLRVPIPDLSVWKGIGWFPSPGVPSFWSGSLSALEPMRALWLRI